MRAKAKDFKDSKLEVMWIDFNAKDGTYLFTEDKIIPETIPEELIMYMIRKDEYDDEHHTLHESVKVKFGGTIFSNKPIRLNRDGYLRIRDWNIIVEEDLDILDDSNKWMLDYINYEQG